MHIINETTMSVCERIYHTMLMNLSVVNIHPITISYRSLLELKFV